MNSLIGQSSRPSRSRRTMAGVKCVALLEVLTLLWTLSRADVGGESNTTIFPFTTMNVTLSDATNSWTSVGAVVGRVAVGLGVAGAVGVIIFLEAGFLSVCTEVLNFRVQTQRLHLSTVRSCQTPTDRPPTNTSAPSQLPLCIPDHVQDSCGPQRRASSCIRSLRM